MPNKVWISNTLSNLVCLKIDDKKKPYQFYPSFYLIVCKTEGKRIQ